MDPKETSDRIELRALVDRYAHIPDDRAYDLVDQLFTEEATLVGPGFEMHGRDQIRAAMQAIEQYSATQHNVHNHNVDLSGDQATGDTYCVANHLHEKDGVPHKLDWGVRYRDAYRRDGGVWRIQRRELVLVWEQDLPLRSA